MKKLGLIDDSEIIDVSHPQKWLSANAILKRIDESRGPGLRAFPGAIPGENFLRQLPHIASRGLIEPLHHIVKSAEYYGLDNELAEHSLYLTYTNHVNHLRLLLRGMVVRQLMEMKCASELQDEPWCEPKPVKSYEEDKAALLFHFGHPDNSSGDETIDHLRISEIYKYGAGPAYYRLNANGEAIKREKKERALEVIGVPQEV